MTFDHLLLNEEFMQRISGISLNNNREYFVNSYFSELVILRKLAAEIEYETKLPVCRGITEKKELYLGQYMRMH